VLDLAGRAVMAAVEASARRTVSPVDSPATSSERYAGSSAKPHGLTAASMPAVSASTNVVCVIAQPASSATLPSKSTLSIHPLPSTLPSRSRKTYVLCSVISNFFHTAPAWSLRWMTSPT
jgi:phosphoribosylcarboxyaminoimidazole (NCAIR) mutase